MAVYGIESNIPKVYDKSRNFPSETYNLWKNEILNAIKNAKKTEIIADIGCGTGRFLKLFTEELPKSRIIGVEPSKSMLSKARENYDNVSFLNNSCEELSLEDDSIDIVFMSMAYHHLINKKKAFSEIYRVLCKGGILILRNSTTDSISQEPWTSFFPEALDIELNRSSSIDEILQNAIINNFTIVDSKIINQIAAINGKDYYEKIALRGLSSLAEVSNSNFEIGLYNMKKIQKDNSNFYEPINLFVFKKA